MGLFDNPKYLRLMLFGAIALMVALGISVFLGPTFSRVSFWIALAGGGITWAVWDAGRRIAGAIERRNKQEQGPSDEGQGG